MATADDIVTTALERAGVIPTGQTPSDAYSEKGLELLNDWIAERKSDGLDLQLSELDAADLVYLDASDLPCLKSNLTVLVADHWKLPIPQSVRDHAVSSLDNLRGKYLEAGLQEMELPDLLVSQGRSDIRSGC